MPNLIYRGNVGLVPQWSGADLQLADRVTDTDVYRGPIWICRASALLRGTYGTGGRLGWVVTSSKVSSERKGLGTLTISWEVGGPYANARYLPLDDFRCEIVELMSKVERNKRLYGPEYPTNPDDRIHPTVIKLCYDAVSGTPPKDSQAMSTLRNMFDLDSDPPADGTTWFDQWGFGGTLLAWLQHGHETYYQAGVKYSYVWHSFDLPSLTMGGVIESSPFGGPMAGNTSFSWLRLADCVEPAGVNGSVYKITSSWFGGPGGHWEPTLYS